METQPKTVNIQALNNAFAKIAKYMNKYQLSVLETELRKMVPSANSEVFMAGGSNITDNLLDLNIFVTNPLPVSETQSYNFTKIISECIIRADMAKLFFVMESIKDVEAKGIDSYELDFTELSYNTKKNEYYTHIVITKLLK